ncbi:dolichol-phosphate mannosyltransferase subunit 3 [Syncephalis pseudoplumigaleata]|uniref:Dolichol-phosphate mannosyltransferase subunit 3 n=1 Tax=Syncephalis pseudoplumigaleata TaxID=1712513 RepID=A0A4P9YUW0_9FUNG|nr:dolichol-phosphate mannosyltransferase subunit 3 [Syncephalis pseudoplumigaleata]|eukprot:RKP23634.1 dolichol-phosphate mannosyltransferase subunit 3 [Syncephalis pseudoplumigaleata]
MTKASETLTGLVLGLSLWASLFYAKLPVDQAIQAQIVPCLPLVALVWFGAYSLGSVGWSLMTFPECSGAYEELMDEIAQAKAELRGKVDLQQ